MRFAPAPTVLFVASSSGTPRHPSPLLRKHCRSSLRSAQDTSATATGAVESLASEATSLTASLVSNVACASASLPSDLASAASGAESPATSLLSNGADGVSGVSAPRVRSRRKQGSRMHRECSAPPHRCCRAWERTFRPRWRAWRRSVAVRSTRSSRRLRAILYVVFRSLRLRRPFSSKRVSSRPTETFFQAGAKSMLSFLLGDSGASSYIMAKSV
jgi:hypothetical protein